MKYLLIFILVLFIYSCSNDNLGKNTNNGTNIKKDILSGEGTGGLGKTSGIGGR